MTSLRGVSNASSVTATLTVPLVTGTVAGDLILIFACGNNVTVAAAAGFSSAGAATGAANGRAFVRTADGTEPSSFALTINTSGLVSCAISAVYAGPASLDPAAIPTPYTTATVSSSLPVPAVTLTGSSDWLAWFGCGMLTAGASGLTVTAPSGFTSRETVALFDSGVAEIAMTFADIESPQSSGSTGTKTGTCSYSAKQAGWMVGISPAAPAAGVNSGAFLDFF
jgi:hypothetical protein